MLLFTTLALHPPRAHLVATGEFDAFSAIDLRSRLDEAVDRGCISFTVDVSAVSFVDAGGLGTLVRLDNAVTPYGGGILVVDASPNFRWLAGIAGLGDRFGLDLLADDPLRQLVGSASHLGRADRAG